MRNREGRTYNFKITTTYQDYIIIVWGYSPNNAKHNALNIFHNRYDIIEDIADITPVAL